MLAFHVPWRGRGRKWKTGDWHHCHIDTRSAPSALLPSLSLPPTPPATSEARAPSSADLQPGDGLHLTPPPTITFQSPASLAVLSICFPSFGNLLKFPVYRYSSSLLFFVLQIYSFLCFCVIRPAEFWGAAGGECMCSLWSWAIGAYNYSIKQDGVTPLRAVNWASIQVMQETISQFHFRYRNIFD